MPKVIIPFSGRNYTDNKHEINMDGESLEEIAEMDDEASRINPNLINNSCHFDHLSSAWHDKNMAGIHEK